MRKMSDNEKKSGSIDSPPSLTEEEMGKREGTGEESSVATGGGYAVDSTAGDVMSGITSHKGESESVVASLLHSGSFGDPAVTSGGELDEQKPTVQEDTDNDHKPVAAYINYGLAKWEETRQKWLRHQTTYEEINSRKRQHPVHVNVDEIIDVIFQSPRQIKLNGGVHPRFPQNVPLPQMVDILQDLWEAEGLDV
jgi:hypothetical protein